VIIMRYINLVNEYLHQRGQKFDMFHSTSVIVETDFFSYFYQVLGKKINNHPRTCSNKKFDTK
jgi:hypothetical protein